MVVRVVIIGGLVFAFLDINWLVSNTLLLGHISISI